MGGQEEDIHDEHAFSVKYETMCRLCNGDKKTEWESGKLWKYGKKVNECWLRLKWKPSGRTKMNFKKRSSGHEREDEKWNSEQERRRRRRRMEGERRREYVRAWKQQSHKSHVRLHKRAYQWKREKQKPQEKNHISKTSKYSHTKLLAGMKSTTKEENKRNSMWDKEKKDKKWNEAKKNESKCDWN